MNEPRHYIFAVKQGSPFGSDTYTLYHYQTKGEAKIHRQVWNKATAKDPYLSVFPLSIATSEEYISVHLRYIIGKYDTVKNVYPDKPIAREVKRRPKNLVYYWYYEDADGNEWSLDILGKPVDFNDEHVAFPKYKSHAKELRDIYLKQANIYKWPKYPFKLREIEG